MWNYKSTSNGFSLLEVLVSLSLVAICTSALIPAFHSQMHQNTLLERRSEAIQAAQTVLDDLRFRDPATLPETGTDSPITIDSGRRSYAVRTSYCERPEYCSSNTRHLTVRVYFQSRKIYEVETAYTKLR